MDEISTSDTSVVSGGGESSSSPGASSGAVAETTTPAAPTQPAEVQVQPATSGETVTAPSGDEFPDDAAFQALPGQERGTQWQRARARISELNEQLRQAQATPQIDPQLQADADLTRSLFGYQQDEYGNPVTDQNGRPYITTAPFLQTLQQQSPDTFYTMMWEGLNQQIDANQTVGDWILQQRYGLSPQLLDTYKQIQSPQDALRFNPQMVDPAELQGVPQELQEAYKSFQAEDRYDLQDLASRDEQRFLSRLRERKENLDNQKFIQETRQKEEQAKQWQQQQWEEQIKSKTYDRGNSKWNQTIDSQKQQLQKQYQPFGPDSEGNEMVYRDILSSAEGALRSPQLQQKTEAAWNQYYLHEYYTATGNPMLAARALADADKLALELQREYAKAVTRGIEQWDRYLKGRITAVVPANGQTQQQSLNSPNQQTPQQQQQNGQPQYKEPGRFGLSQGRINEIAAQLAVERARQAG